MILPNQTNCDRDRTAAPLRYFTLPGTSNDWGIWIAAGLSARALKSRLRDYFFRAENLKVTIVLPMNMGRKCNVDGKTAPFFTRRIDGPVGAAVGYCRRADNATHDDPAGLRFNHHRQRIRRWRSV